MAEVRYVNESFTNRFMNMMIIKKIALAVILLSGGVCTLEAASPVKLKGRITEAQGGEPIVGAVVNLDKNYLWAVSDAQGNFTMNGIEPGDYSISVTCLGYVDYESKISMKQDVADYSVKLSVNSLALKEVVVTAEKSKDNLNTTSKINRNALDHLQLANMADISALLPGGKTINPDLTTDNVMSLRTGGSSAGNAAFGTAVEVDGVRLGDNASFGTMSGTGTRSISVDNIESIEVLTGVPSAEYGDLNSGMIRVITKKGRTPANIVFSVNPRTYETSASKGIDLGQGKGILNVSLEWAKATKKLTSPYTSYTRRGFTFDYSNTFAKKIRLEAGMTGNIGGMNSKDDPDLFSNEYSKSRDYLLTPHFKATWLLNKDWITNLRLEGSIYYHDSRSHDHIYNSYGSSQPAVHSEQEGYYIADSLPLTFYSDLIEDSRELDYSLSLNYDWLHHWGGIKSVLKAGLKWNADGNVGDGEYYEDPSLAANGYRPRPYTDYPYMHNVAAYAEDNLTIPVGKTSLDLSAGLRIEDVFIKNTSYNDLQTLSPRLNAKWSISDSFSVRCGWGITQKLPSFYILYPKQEYRDIQSFGASYGTSGKAAYVYHTIPYTITYNPDLKWQSNSNSEIGIDASFKGFKISLAGFIDVTRNPYALYNSYTPVYNMIMTTPSGFTMPSSPVFQIDSNFGGISVSGDGGTTWTAMSTKVKDQTFVNSSKQGNGKNIRRSGIELTVDFPEVKPILTTFRLDGAWNHSRYVDDTKYYYYNTGWSHTSLPDRSYQYVGIYAGGSQVANGQKIDNIDANLTAITHIPQAKLIFTVRVEAALMRHSQNLSEYDGKTYAFTVSGSSNSPTGGNIYDGNSYSAIYPVAYLDLEGNTHEWTDECASNPELSRLIMRSGNIYTFAKDGYDPYVSANLSITKEIGNHVSLSFFANNFTNSRRYVTSYATGVSAIFTPNFYYGLTCRLKF